MGGRDQSKKPFLASYSAGCCAVHTYWPERSCRPHGHDHVGVEGPSGYAWNTRFEHRNVPALLHVPQGHPRSLQRAPQPGVAGYAGPGSPAPDANVFGRVASRRARISEMHKLPRWRRHTKSKPTVGWISRSKCPQKPLALSPL